MSCFDGLLHQGDCARARSSPDEAEKTANNDRRPNPHHFADLVEANEARSKKKRPGLYAAPPEAGIYNVRVRDVK